MCALISKYSNIQDMWSTNAIFLACNMNNYEHTELSPYAVDISDRFGVQLGFLPM